MNYKNCEENSPKLIKQKLLIKKMSSESVQQPKVLDIDSYLNTSGLRILLPYFFSVFTLFAI